MLKPNDKPACADPSVDPEWWFPEPDGRGSVLSDANKLRTLSALEAMEICHGCPLMANGRCLEYAMSDTTTIDYGIYAGTLPFERKMAVGHSLTGDTTIWQQKIRAIANKKGIPTPKLAKRERPKPSRLIYVPAFIGKEKQ